MDMEQKIAAAHEQFDKVIRSQLARVERMAEQKDFIDYDKLDKLTIGVCGGDGIGPVITKESARVL